MARIVGLPDQLQGDLRDDEQVTWTGRPVPGRYAVKKSMMMFLFGIIWNFALWNSALEKGFDLGELSQLLDSGRLPTLIWYPIAAAGLVLITSPFWQYWRALRTHYVVTNQRVLIANRRLWPTTESFGPADIGPRKFKWSGTDTGTLIFNWTRGADSDVGPLVLETGFVEIKDIREAERHIAALNEKR